jgi:lipid-binding SYLF domain-containing protein
MKNFIAAVLVAFSMGSVAIAHAADAKLDDRISAAHAVLHELMATPDRGVPLDIAAKATCVAVVPGFKKGAFLVGAQYGQGVATCRTGHGWSAPVFIQLTGASFGLQAGGQSTDLVLVGTNYHSMQALLKDKIKLGVATRRLRPQSWRVLSFLPTRAVRASSLASISRVMS